MQKSIKYLFFFLINDYLSYDGLVETLSCFPACFVLVLVLIAM